MNGANSIELLNTFILRQPETLQVQWDQQTFFPQGRAPRGRGKKKSKKEKRREKRIEKGKKQEKKSKAKIREGKRDEEL